MIRFFIISLMFWSCTSNNAMEAKMKSVPYETITIETKSDSLLNGIEGKIMMAFAQGIMSKDVSKMDALDTELETFSKSRKNNLVFYWRSYLMFYKTILYMEAGEKKKAGKLCNKAIEIMEGLKGKNAEDYALLAMLQGISFEFIPGIKAPFLAKKVEENLNTALEIDSLNLRVNFVVANNDLHTPEKYGGGKKVEKYALKAISLPAQKVKNSYLPSWGKEEAYETLIKFYIKKEKWELAKKYYKEAHGNYPQSYLIAQLAPQLIDK